MKTRSVTETAILSASVLTALIVLIVGASSHVHGRSAAIVIVVIILAGIGLTMWFRQNSHASTARSVPARGEEYWRLAEMAVTAQEHTDLRLGEVSVQMDQMRAQLDSVQKILSDVE